MWLGKLRDSNGVEEAYHPRVDGEDSANLVLLEHERQADRITVEENGFAYWLMHDLNVDTNSYLARWIRSVRDDGMMG